MDGFGGFSWFIIVAIVLIVLFLILIIIAFIYDSWIIGALALLFLFIALTLIVYWALYVDTSGNPQPPGPTGCNVGFTGFPGCTTCLPGFTGPNCVPISPTGCPAGFTGLPDCNVATSGFITYGDFLLLQNVIDGGFAGPCGLSNCDSSGANLIVTTRTDASYNANNGNTNNLRKWQILSATGPVSIGTTVKYGDVIFLKSMASNPGGPSPQFNMSVCTTSTVACGLQAIVGANETASADRWIIQRDRSNSTPNLAVSYSDSINLLNQNFGFVNNYLGTCVNMLTGSGCGFGISATVYRNAPITTNYQGSSIWKMLHLVQ